jgi:hypothetical protein
MKTALRSILLLAVLGLVLPCATLGQSFTDIQGKWTLKKKSNRWGEATQTVTFKDNKFTYKVTSKDGDTLLYARGKAKVEKLGSFKVIKLTDIEGGNSESNLDAINDDRELIYSTGWNTITVAVNFDRARDNEDTEADTYSKVKE